ncbi:NUDIX domain-containing protein [Paenibacillus xylaniclasticus]|uniref:NUDIX domain-containing protein n=1 Tax=Paenibacillus xylaniclasticus TaxID=588083 RepID=UPI0017753E9A|nr:hypothetical protein PCURB6_42140 [Paenibacillus curdlanolyticus]
MINEETGITEVDLYNSNRLDQFYSSADNYIYMAPVFVGYVEDGQDVVLNHEHSEYRWMTFDEAVKSTVIPVMIRFFCLWRSISPSVSQQSGCVRCRRGRVGPV